MSTFTVSISFPFADGTYSDFEDITSDVVESSLGTLKQTLEANDLDIGKITFGGIKLVLRNETAKYSEAVNASSIFPLKRDESIIQIEWDRNEDGMHCGNSFCGHTFLSDNRVVFKGLLEDNVSSFEVDSQLQKFSILSMDSIVNKVDTPFSSLLLADTAEELLFKILDQVKITQFFTVDALNISVPNNIAMDDISSLENTDCLEAIQEILLIGNAIMFVKDDVIYIRSREEDPTSTHIFYGPSSDLGIESIHNISSYSAGLNRCFNFWTWKGTSVVQKFQDSIDKNGLRKKQLDSELVTDTGKITAILLSYLTEFGFPKTEMNLTVPMTTPTSDLTFLNKINIDYPSDVLPVKDEVTSRYGQAVYGESRYARTINSLFISIDQEWKILNITTNTKSHILTYKIREV